MKLKKFFARKNNDVAAGLLIHQGLYRYIALERKNDTYSVIAALADCVKGGSFTEQTDMIFERLRSFADTSIKISLSLPISDTMLRTVSLPMDINEAKMSMRYELEKYFPVNNEEALFDLAEIDFPFSEQYDGKYYLLAATRRSNVKIMREAAAHYGFQIECIEPAQIALERAASLYSYNRATLLVYVGNRYLQQILFWHGNGIFYRAADLNNYEPFESMSSISSLSTEHLDNCVREIQAFMSDAYNATKIMPKSVAIFGPCADRDFAAILEQSFENMNVDCINLMEINAIEMGKEGYLAKGYWDVPIGLALRHFDGS